MRAEDERCAGEYFFRTLLSGVCGEECADRAIGGQGTRSIWAKTFRMLKPYFEMETGQMFASGLKVLVKVSVEFHELYGLSLTVLDIDPAYTLGDMCVSVWRLSANCRRKGLYAE